jgi:hypothetical protein
VEKSMRVGRWSDDSQTIMPVSAPARKVWEDFKILYISASLS